jgi:branched-chain amino acid aminotransferase
MPEIIWFDGEVRPAAEHMLPHDERGYLYGDGIFETVRAYGGHPFRAEAHAARMLQSARALEIAPAPAAEEFASALREACRAATEGMGEAYLRATLSRGRGYGPDISAGFDARFLVYAKPLSPPAPSLYETGVRAILSAEPRSSGGGLSRHKSLSYLECLMARREATRAGAEEALILDSDGVLLEGACSNLFLVRDGTLKTPPLSRNLLPGVTRAAVLELARAAGIPAAEEAIRPEDFESADEAFLTNSIQEIVPLVNVGGAPVGGGRPGPVAGRLRELYRTLVAEETE